MTSGSFAGAEMITLRAPACEVLLGVGARAEEAGRLDHDLDAELAPRQLRRVGLGRHGDPAPVDDDRAVGCLDVPANGP